MGDPRRPVCMALDPIPDTLASGRKVNRHCTLAAGHQGMHQSRDTRGDPVHEWQWIGDPNQPVLGNQDRLF